MQNPQKMNQRVKELYCTALESGKYKEGKSYLNNEGRFCGLGVLCDLYIQETGRLSWERYMHGIKKIGNKHAVLPKEIVKWSGLETDNGHLGETSITILNDGGMSHKDLAKIIREKL